MDIRKGNSQTRADKPGWGLKILLLALVLQLVTPLPLAYLGPEPAQAGWRDRVRQSVDRTRQRVRQSVDRGRERIRRDTQRHRSNVDRAVRERSQRAREALQRSRERARRSSEQRVRELRERARQDAARRQRQLREAASRRAAEIRRRTEEAARRARVEVRRRQERVAEMVRTSANRSGAGRLVRRFQRQSPSQIISTIQRTHGRRAMEAIEQTSRRLGQGAGAAVATYLARARTGGMDVLRRAQPVIERVSRQVRDPRTQRRVVMGVMAAAGVAYYVHRHREDIKYRAIDYSLRRTMVPVNGRRVSLNQVITSQILARAPYLRGTRLAEDPAAVLAYGVVAVGREDLMNNVAIVPDGRGNLRSVNASIRSVEHGQDALMALQVGTSLEGMAMTAAENGVLGVHGQTFAGSYRAMERRLGQ